MGLGIAMWFMFTGGVLLLTLLSLIGTWKFRNIGGKFLTHPWRKLALLFLLLVIDFLLIALSVWCIYGIFVLIGAARDIFG